MIGTIIYVGGENVTFRPISSQNRRFPFDSDPGKLTISRRWTIIVLGNETTLTEDTKGGSMSLGVRLSVVLSCSLFLSACWLDSFTVLVCVSVVESRPPVCLFVFYQTASGRPQNRAF
jgi:hypothetical protein